MAEKRKILITGSTDGIGLETARQLEAQGQEVILHGRSQARLDAARKALRRPELQGVAADLSDFSQVAALKPQVEKLGGRLDVLINNAGTYNKERHLNREGIEMTLAVNHFGHMLLSLELLPFLRRGTKPRIVNVSSGVHRGASLDLDDFSMAKGFSPYGAYAASKLANLLFTGRLVREPAFEGILCFGLHPGVIGTKLLRQNFGVGGASLDSGAKTSVLCATGEGLEKYQGAYFSDARPQEASAESLDSRKQDKLWERSMGLLRPYLKAAA